MDGPELWSQNQTKKTHLSKTKNYKKLFEYDLDRAQLLFSTPQGS